jgi:dephospho-CoA kinase
MLLVALTGGIGSGKSTVADMLRDRGALVLDADEVARDVVAPGTAALAAIEDRFGGDVIRADGSLDRDALAARVFADEDARRALEEITHPVIQAEFARAIADAPTGSIVVCDIPLLVESDSVASRGYAAVIVVQAPKAIRLERLERRGLDPESARARMATQAGDEARAAVATHLLDNGGDLDALREQVDDVWQELAAMAEATT